MNTLVFINDDQFLNRFAASLPADSTWTFIPLSWKAHRVLQQRNLTFLTFHQLLDPVVDKIERWAANVAHEWPLDAQNQDITIFHGVSVRDLYDTFLRISIVYPVFKWSALVDRAIETAFPQRILCDATAPAILRTVLKSLTTPLIVEFWGNEQVPDLMREALGPTISWQLPRRRGRRDMLVRPLHNIASAMIRGLRRHIRPKAPYRLLGHYYQSLSPVYRRLLVPPWNNFFSLDVSGLPPTKMLLKMFRSGVPLIPPMKQRVSDVIKTEADRLWNHWQYHKSKKSIPQSSLMNQVNLWHVLTETLDGVLKNYFLEGVRFVDHYERLFSATTYNFVLLPYDSMPQTRAIVEVAKKHQLQTVTLAHGIYNISEFYKEGFATDFVAVEGRLMQNRFVKLGRSPEAILTGAGLFDDQHPIAHEPPHNLRTKLLVLTHPMVLYEMRDYPGTSENHLLDILSVLNAFPDLTLTIKLHPSESTSHYRDVLTACGLSHLVIEKETPFKDLLRQHGTVIGSFSTALMEAAIHKRWVASVNFTRHSFPPPFDGSGGLPTFQSQEALRDWVQALIAPNCPPPDHSQFITNCSSSVDGIQSERFLRELASRLKI